MENPGKTIKENLLELEGKILELLENFENGNGVNITCIDYKHPKNQMNFGESKFDKNQVKIFVEIS